MIAVDTNILVYAHRPDYGDLHERALAVMNLLANGHRQWAIPWPCLHEFLGNVTNARIYKMPTSLHIALDAVSIWCGAERMRTLGESDEHFATLSQLCIDADVSGSRIHDAQIAAICVDHAVSQLWTADRDFLLFHPRLTVHNPLKNPDHV